MATTMQPGTDSQQYRRQDAALTRFQALGGSRTAAGAHAKELRTWATARQLIACYPIARALRAIEDLRSYIADMIRPVTPQRILEADAADRNEDTAETRYLLDPNPGTKEHYIRALVAEAAADLALARDLKAQA